MTPIYLDNNGTTPVDPLVLNAMLPFLQGEFGNPSSNTPLGNRAHDAIETARAKVARLIGAKPDEITFTSGGTEFEQYCYPRGGPAQSRTPQYCHHNHRAPGDRKLLRFRREGWTSG